MIKKRNSPIFNSIKSITFIFDYSPFLKEPHNYNPEEFKQSLIKLTKDTFNSSNVNKRFIEDRLCGKYSDSFRYYEKHKFRSALHWLCCNKYFLMEPNIECVEYLLSIGGDVNQLASSWKPDNEHASTALLALCKQVVIRAKLERVIYYLYEKHANPFLSMPNEKNCFEELVYRGSYNIFLRLLLKVYHRIGASNYKYFGKPGNSKLSFYKISSPIPIKLFHFFHNRAIKLTGIKLNSLNFLTGVPKTNQQSNSGSGSKKKLEFVEPLTQANILHIFCLFQNKDPNLLKLIFKYIGVLLKKGAVVPDSKMILELTPLHLLVLMNQFSDFKNEKNNGTGNEKLQKAMDEKEENEKTDQNKRVKENGETENELKKESGTETKEKTEQQNFHYFKETISLVVKYGGDINLKDMNGRTPLITYCRTNNPKLEFIKFLIKNGADYSILTGRKSNLLHTICKIKNPPSEIIGYFLEKGIEINAKAYKDFTPLLCLCRNEPSFKILKFLIENGADVNCKDIYKQTPLHYFSKSINPSPRVLKLFLENGADINCKDEKGFTPLHHLCSNNNVSNENIELLIQKKVKINEVTFVTKETPLHLMCDKYDPSYEIIKLLCENGANVQAKREDGTTALFSILNRDNPNAKIIQTFLKYKVDLNYRTRTRWPPLLLICYHKNPSIKTIKLFLKNGANSNALTRSKRTALSLICKKEKPPLRIIKLFVKSGLDVNSTDDVGYTCLHFLCKNSLDAKVIDYLLSNGANPNLKEKAFGNTALHILIEHKNEAISEIIKIFLQHKADISIKNHKGMNVFRKAKLIQNKIAIREIKNYFQNQSQIFKTASDLEMALNQVGKTVSNFQKIPSKDVKILSQVGRGSFKDVYEGRWMDRRVAVAQFFNAKNFEQEQLNEIIEEVKLMCRLSHPQIVKFYGACIDDPENIMLISEFCSGGNLHKYLGSSKRISKKKKLKIALEIALGIQYLHSNHFVHRDIKSPNILLDQNFDPKITDFGLTKTMNIHNSIDFNTVVGTMAWMAPELLRDEKDYTNKVDIYAFGILLWEISTRSVPFDELNFLKIPIKVGYEKYRPEIDEKDLFYKLIIQCWDQDPNERPDIYSVVKQLQMMK
ncbi:ankyrin repeat and protein kinase domain-containing protein [Anaeramoeba flamelloides]|uniref:Ankyrin repeat and protein kinase domain-containing protein n=1 Tax=Anaeramoeba flamelloides TaxID=1746091 RepID=A0AAV7YG21_9EUKA|nr:ankyrin repeat and protein kinase domain-containing protein [Anaeramoeba flamelloides]